MIDSPSTGFAILSVVDHPPILLGTSSTTGWQGSFCPKGMRPADTEILFWVDAVEDRSRKRSIEFEPLSPNKDSGNAIPERTGC
jgi:hypothetical protein